MKLLIADDETLIREAILARLKKGNYAFDEIFLAADGLEAWDIARRERPEIIITDVQMDGMTGLSLIQSCQNAHIPASIIVISGYAEFEYVQDAMYHDACCYLLKPITQESLFDALEKALAKQAEHARLSGLQNDTTNPSSDILLTKHGSPQEPESPLSVTEQARRYLTEHYREPVSIETLAEYLHLNPRYFSTLFKKKEGVSPLDYLTRIRMEAAKDLLRDTDIPASEVSYLVGYEDPRYFYKVFKKYTGQTPTNFRS